MGISIDRTNGNVILYQAGADSVSVAGAISATTSVSLGELKGYFMNMTVFNEAYDQASLENAVNI